MLFLVLAKLGFEQAERCHHLSYGMVELPEGKMKSREGTVVDADDLMEEMFGIARDIAQEAGKLDGLGGRAAGSVRARGTQRIEILPHQGGSEEEHDVRPEGVH